MALGLLRFSRNQYFEVIWRDLFWITFSWKTAKEKKEIFKVLWFRNHRNFKNLWNLLQKIAMIISFFFLIDEHCSFLFTSGQFGCDRACLDRHIWLYMFTSLWITHQQGCPGLHSLSCTWLPSTRGILHGILLCSKTEVSWKHCMASACPVLMDAVRHLKWHCVTESNPWNKYSRQLKINLFSPNNFLFGMVQVLDGILASVLQIAVHWEF